jgi:diguanylate cyclase (GGDEF)-like protein
MNNLQILTQVFIETLKDFHNNKQPLTVDSLYMALFAKQELSAILSNTAVITSLNPNPVLGNNLNSNNSMSEKCYLHVTEVRNRFLDIINICTPLLDDDDDTQRFNRMKKIIIDSTTVDILLSHGVDILDLMNMLIDNAISRMTYTNEFLTELSKDLIQMEKQLLLYHTYNNEMHSNDNAFSDTLLSHTKDMNYILSTNKRLSEIRSFIVSKLSLIAESIEKKRHEDELKLKAAEERMNELQNCLRTYGDEILLVKERANALEKEVLLDQLMGISNRRGYELQIRESFRRYHRHQESFGLILMDVDDFKTVNDTYGHQAGDRCLQEIAKAISFCLRKTDFLARYGGDEIIAILPGAVADETRKIAEKIRMCIEKTVFWHNQEHFSVTISIGVAAVTATDEEPGSLFSRVDRAIYEAKKCGRNRIIEL